MYRINPSVEATLHCAVYEFLSHAWTAAIEAAHSQ